MGNCLINICTEGSVFNHAVPTTDEKSVLEAGYENDGRTFNEDASWKSVPFYGFMKELPVVSMVYAQNPA